MKFEIFKHQQKVIDFITKDTNRGILVFHSVGSGKTLTALLAAKELVKKYTSKKVIIATPASLVSNFMNEKEKIPNHATVFADKLQIFSYQKLVNILAKGDSMCANTIFIVDEAHNLNGGGETYKALFRCSKKAFKIILLSATPVKNTPGEIARQLSILEGKTVSPKTIDNIKNLNSVIKQKQIMDTFFKCKISYFLNNDKSNYPNVSEEIIRFYMPKDYYEKYYNIQEGIKKDIPDYLTNTRNLTVFFNGIRRAVNTLNEPSEKFKWVVSKIATELDKGNKVLIYSTWVEGGINVIKRILLGAEIPFSEVSGSMNKTTKDKNVLKFNRGNTKVLLITASGAEGLNLKEVRSVIIMEPHWNKTRIHQVIGRASRYMSHSKLPPEERTVKVYHLIIEKPRDYRIDGDSMPSADNLLINKSDTKQVDIDKFYMWLKRMSIEHDKTCH
jgi:SNF2 family DNA or RNA helicase